MIDFGSSTSTNLHIGFGDLDYLDGLTSVSILARGRVKTFSTGGGTVQLICGKAASGGYAVDGGWQYQIYKAGTSDWRFRFAWGAGSSVKDEVDSNASSVPENTFMTFGVVWAPNDYAYFYKDGAGIGSPATANVSVASHSDGFAINSRYDGNPAAGGGSWDLDNLVVYANHQLTADEITAYHEGILPRPDKVSFFWSGDGAPGYNEIKHASGGGEAGTNRNGTPTAGVSCAGLTWSRLSFALAQIARSGESEAPSQAGLMADPMYAELVGRGRVYFAVEIDLPDGTTLRYSDAALMTEEGLYYDKIRQWSTIRKSTSISNFNIDRPETSILLIDKDRSLAKRLGGDLRGRIEGAAVRELLISRYVPSEHWFPVFRGSFLRWENAGPGPLIRLYFGPNDKPLQRGARLGVIDSTRFPDVSDEVKNTAVQVVAGVHAKSGGAVNAFRVSDTEWLVSAGWISDVTQVYENGSVSANSWSAQYSEREGYYFTEVKYDSNPGDVEVTVDCHGLELFGDGSGGPITNPSDQLVQLLVNFYFSEYRRGSWLKAEDIDAPIQTEYLASVASLMSLYGWKGKQIITEEVTGYQLINKWSDQWKQPVFFTFAGELAAKPNPFYRIPTDNAELREGRDDLGPLTTRPRDDSLKDEVIVKHDYVFATGVTNDETKAVDVSKDYGSSRTITLDWSAE